MNRYDKMIDGYPYQGEIFKDPLSINFSTDDSLLFSTTEYQLMSPDVSRFDALVEAVYGDANYDFILLWKNGKSCSFELATGDTINLYSKRDMVTIGDSL